jgi:hypothetical protein
MPDNQQKHSDVAEIPLSGISVRFYVAGRSGPIPGHHANVTVES